MVVLVLVAAAPSAGDLHVGITIPSSDPDHIRSRIDFVRSFGGDSTNSRCHRVQYGRSARCGALHHDADAGAGAGVGAGETAP